MKKLYLIGFMLLTSVFSFSQTQEVIMETLTNAAASMQCMNCRFTQQKTMAMLAEPTVSEGLMGYNSPDKMRWEYTSPYSFALVVDGDKITKITDGNEELLDAKSGRMYQGIVNIIMSSATGKKLFDKTMFNVDIQDVGEFWKAEMKPKKQNMKRMFSMLTFYFGKTDNIINKVEMTEAGGDMTTIQFYDMKINELCD
ncbi:MAG: outer membrane lipoprotein carrier protein LolA [Bacteroidales bacterium]|nr:outer membrane lipoprotein carrier protein LolA [Bacteroidales bacterium]